MTADKKARERRIRQRRAYAAISLSHHSGCTCDVCRACAEMRKVDADERDRG